MRQLLRREAQHESRALCCLLKIVHAKMFKSGTEDVRWERR